MRFLFRSLGIIGCFLVCTGAIVSAEEPLIIAHRGASHDAPENTMAAFRLAWEQGADGIEGDFYLTSDGKIICTHDKTTERVATKNCPVANTAFQELRGLDVGTWMSPKFAGERMPSLSEVLAVVPEGKRIYVEIKCGPEIVPHLQPAFAACGLEPDQLRVIAFDEDVIAAVKEQLPGIKAYWLTGFKQDPKTRQWKPTPQQVFDTLKQTKADGLGAKGETKVINQEFVKALRAGGWEFHVWTIDEPRPADYFRELGVDSITTNRPAFVRDSLQSNKVFRKHQ